VKPVIRVENLSKRYRIGTPKGRDYQTLREALVQAASVPWRRLRRWLARGRNGGHAAGDGPPDSIWPLREVSFDVQAGEVVGVIGRNGAGKSTLLKVLSEITEPTAGRVELRGRVGSLLEIGTGFHYELSGRENIYLNGAILGMTRREIARKFDEIVAFSEIEQFLDTPVKRYSSGMYMRLAFAVAAHLDPEILLIDEVLAVGDQAFQKKCLGKMREVGQSGRTVLFVSHDMATILNLCSKTVVLANGQVDYVGGTAEGVQRYMRMAGTAQSADVDLTAHPARRRGYKPHFRRLRLLNRHGEVTDRFQCGDGLTVELTCEPPAQQAVSAPEVGLGVYDWMGARLFTLATYLSPCELPPLQGPRKIVCRVEELPLMPGRYTLSLVLGVYHDRFLDGRDHDYMVDVLDHPVAFEIEPGDFFGNGRVPKAGLGRVLVRSQWETAD
jgi:lipopolysaccharide transport system ATP-binding protein